MSEQLRLMRLAMREIETITGELQKLAPKLDQPGYRVFRNRTSKAARFADDLLRLAIRYETDDTHFANMSEAPPPHLPPLWPQRETPSYLRLVVDNEGDHAA